MAIFNWLSLTNGQIVAFDPLLDKLVFNDAAISAAGLSFGSTASTSIFSFGGKTVTLQSAPATLTTTNVNFQDGSLFLYGDNATGTAGDSLANTLTGGAGNDQLNGSAGSDTMIGGTGNDTYIVAQAGDVVTELPGEGTDTVRSSISYTLPANVENLTLLGTADNQATGNALDNIITGNAGHNYLYGGEGMDTLIGGLGDDFYTILHSGQVVVEALNEGFDTVETPLSWTLAANVEELRLIGVDNVNGTGNALDNVLRGNTGNNVLYGAAGNDTMIGGTGNDVYIVNAAGDVVTELPGEGTDTVRSSINYTLPVNVENLVLTGAGNTNGTGNSLNNIITGNAGNNILNGSAGSDTMIGGTGNDTYIVAQAGDVVTELPGEGTDTVRSSISYTLPANVENLTLLGTADNQATGNALDNIITGNAGHNYLYGGEGMDTLIGGLGDDFYTILHSGQVVVEALNEGFDTVETPLSWTLAANVEELRLIGVDNVNGTGNALDNVLRGNTGNNVLYGAAGNDTMIGGTGNDVYIVNAAGDVVTELPGEGTDTVRSSINYTLPVNVENLVLTGAGNINGTGNSLNNIITGNAGNNILNGGAGTDTLNGSTGADRLNGGDGNDTLVWHAADVIVNGAAGADTLRVDGVTALDLTTVPDTKIANVETINLAGTVTLTLALADVLAISSTTDILTVDGGVGDTVHRGAGWTQGADQVGYHVYTQGLATLQVDVDITSVV